MRPESGVYVKDLSIIADRNIQEMVIVDNSIISFAFDLSSGIPIKAFVGESNDDELLYMVTYLEQLFGAKDVRKSLETTFRMKEISKSVSKHGIRGKSDKQKLMQEAKESLHVKT